MLYIYRLQNGSFASGVWGPVRGSLSLYRDTDRSRSNYQAGGDRYRWKNKNTQFCLLRINLHEKCSYKEGFRFKSSDLDAMIWYTKHKVICDISQFKFSYPLNIDFVLIDHSDTPSEFVKLRLLFPRRDLLPLEIIHLRDISSEKFRRKYYQFLRKTHTHAKTLRFHGPCSSYNIEHKEFDRGWCVACQYWPPAAGLTDANKRDGQSEV